MPGKALVAHGHVCGRKSESFLGIIAYVRNKLPVNNELFIMSIFIIIILINFFIELISLHNANTLFAGKPFAYISHGFFLLKD
jgi:hypothetical protein